jgi:lipopolysaccharide/colanic/teichoic acid biosynthesis glycosyltransferase
LGAIGLLQPSGYFRWKDVPGRLLACLLFVLGLPIMALTIAAVRLTSRGPAIFKQTRVGRNCRVYTMYKIRTMRVDAEAATGPVWTQTNDPRITPVGRLIRRLHLDEFPQLINVLRGEMALIGPRPERPEFTQRLAMALPRYLDRLAVRPGITGLAQVNLPPDTDLDSVGRKLVLDLHYVREARLGLDLRLLACAIAQILGFRGPSAARFFGVEMAVDLTPYDEGEGLAPRVERAPTRSRTRMRAGENRAQGNRAAVRPSVPSSLSDDALNDLCLDQSDEVEFQLSARQTKSSRARMLVEYQGKIDRLLEHLKRRSA